MVIYLTGTLYEYLDFIQMAVAPKISRKWWIDATRANILWNLSEWNPGKTKTVVCIRQCYIYRTKGDLVVMVEDAYATRCSHALLTASYEIHIVYMNSDVSRFMASGICRMELRRSCVTWIPVLYCIYRFSESGDMQFKIVLSLRITTPSVFYLEVFLGSFPRKVFSEVSPEVSSGIGRCSPTKF